MQNASDTHTGTETLARLPLFETGFRVFFLAAALYAPLALLLFLLDLAGLASPLAGATPLSLTLWHGHELVFGFIVAVAAGFLTTAVPVWAGSPRIHGAPLVGLFLLWLAGRLTMTFAGLLPAWMVALVDLAFVPALAFMIARPILQKRLWRNAGFIPLLLLITLGNILFHAETLGGTGTDGAAATGLRFAIGLFVLMTVMIGGRVIPFFTSNWLARQGKPPLSDSPPLLVRATLIACLLTVLASLFPLPGWVLALLNVAAGLLVLARLSRWQGGRTLSDPLMWVLHAGYGLLGLGFLAAATSHSFDSISEPASLHVITIGGLGVMIYGMMSRIALGHTGRPLVVSPFITAAYFILILSMLLRVIPATFLPDWYFAGIITAGAGWLVVWCLYLVVYTPILIRPRPDGKAG
ncbi:NnrS family protein [Sneathiella chinensis]|uniref:Short-chain dehydrogenase n=1 Tax=Sneathiella chinensis TaxID=349750 RepID=A0ABQ5U7G9_9PROT|nr:NnrS family protein [Sneathiella chinensis]GLQ07741.1 short-chain dehydrogenase [Sneathiella chinensis]